MSDEQLQGLDELVEGTAEEVTRRLFEQTVKIATINDPPLGEILQVCALPEAFDQEMIGMLRQKPKDDETNRRLFDALVAYPFVVSHEDGTYSYHDLLRPGLQDQLRREQPELVARISEQIGKLFMERGQQHYRTGNLAEALLNFRRAIAATSAKLAEAHRWRGRTFAKLGQFEDAARDFGAAAELEPKNSENFFRRASIYIDQERYREAIADLGRAIQLEPDKFPKNYFARGMAHYRLGDYTSSLADFVRAVELIEAIPAHSPRRELQRERARLDEALEGRGIVYLELKHYKEALRDFQGARALNPASSSHQFWCGLAHYYLSQHDESIKQLSGAISLNSSDDLMFRWRGVVFSELKEFHRAKSDFQRALTIDGQKAINHYWLGHAQFHLREYGEALASFNRALEIAPTFYPAHRWRGTLWFGLGNFEQARSDFDTAVAGLAPNPKLYQERGSYIFLEAFHDVARAEQDFNQALSLVEPHSSDEAVLLFWRSQIYIEQAMYQAALGDLNAAVEREARRTRNLFWRGVVHSKLGHDQAAEHDWARVEAINDEELKQWQRRTRLAWLLLLRGSLAEARDQYRHALQDRTNYFLQDLRYQHANLRRIARCFPERSELGEFVRWYAGQIVNYIPSV